MLAVRSGKNDAGQENRTVGFPIPHLSAEQRRVRPGIPHFSLFTFHLSPFTSRKSIPHIILLRNVS